MWRELRRHFDRRQKQTPHKFISIIFKLDIIHISYFLHHEAEIVQRFLIWVERRLANTEITISKTIVQGRKTYRYDIFLRMAAPIQWIPGILAARFFRP